MLETFERADEVKPSGEVMEASQQIQLFPVSSQAIIEELAAIDPNKMTPFRALEMMYKITDQCREELQSHGNT